ncbi:MAG: hypothetical protein ACOH1E_03780, partial [Brevundimonas sp.]
MPKRNGRARSFPHPNRVFRYLTLACALVVAACVWLTLQMVASNVDFSPSIKDETISVRTPGAQ